MEYLTIEGLARASRRPSVGIIHKEWPLIPAGETFTWSGKELQRAMFSGLGQVKDETPVGIVAQIQALFEGYKSLKPFVDFLGDHPVLAFSLLMVSVIAGGAIGGYIGAGLRTSAGPKTGAAVKTGAKPK